MSIEEVNKKAVTVAQMANRFLFMSASLNVKNFLKKAAPIKIEIIKTNLKSYLRDKFKKMNDESCVCSQQNP